ncbi:MAG: hypothetical protein ACI8YQ_004374 [Polaribacter sp.]|jgi:hypothetical protein
MKHYSKISFGYESIGNCYLSMIPIDQKPFPALRYIFDCLKEAIKGCRCNQG